MRGKWFVISASVALVALVAAAVTILYRAAPKKTARAAPVAPAPPPADINLSGKIRPQQTISVAAPVEGTIGALFAEVGQEVFEGQLLARITSAGFETGEQTARREVEMTQSRVNRLESDIITARLEASRARADASRARGEYERLDKIHRRQQMLFSEGATPKLAFEKSSREFEQAQTEFHTLEQLAASAETRVADLVRTMDAEKRTLQEKTDGLETASAKSGAGEVVSPAQGLVVARNGEVGQPVGPDRVDFFQLATQLSQLEVVLEPDPPSMRRIQPGQAALVSLPDQGAGMVGSVKAIQGDQVIVAFTSPTPVVKPGMTAQVRIRVN